MTSGTELSWSSYPLPQPLAHFLLQPQWQGAASGPGSMEAASPIDHSLCVDKHEQSRRGVLGMRTCVASSGPLQPRSFQLHTVVKKTRTATRFPQPLVSWVNIQVPEHDPELGVVVRPAYLFQQVSWNVEKIKHHHHFCRRWPYWFHSPFARTHPIYLCRDHKRLWDSFIGEETGSEGGDAFTKWPHHWFQKSWKLGWRTPVCFPEKHKVNLQATGTVTLRSEYKTSGGPDQCRIEQEAHHSSPEAARGALDPHALLMGILIKHESSDSLFTAAKTGSISSRCHDERWGLWIQNAHHRHSSGFSFLSIKWQTHFLRFLSIGCDQVAKGLSLETLSRHRCNRHTVSSSDPSIRTSSVSSLKKTRTTLGKGWHTSIGSLRLCCSAVFRLNSMTSQQSQVQSWTPPPVIKLCSFPALDPRNNQHLSFSGCYEK